MANHQQGRNQELLEERTAEDSIVARVLAGRQHTYLETPEASETILQRYANEGERQQVPSIFFWRISLGGMLVSCMEREVGKSSQLVAIGNRSCGSGDMLP